MGEGSRDETKCHHQHCCSSKQPLRVELASGSSNLLTRKLTFYLLAEGSKCPPLESQGHGVGEVAQLAVGVAAQLRIGKRHCRTQALVSAISSS